MNTQDSILQDEVLRIVALELMYNDTSVWSSNMGATYQDISKKHRLNMDMVKKKLRILFNYNLVICRGSSPKFWSFNHYNYDRMDFNEPVMQLISRYDDDDYEKFTNIN